MSGSVREVRPGVWKVTVYVGRGRQRSRTFEAKGVREANRLANGHADELLKAHQQVEKGTVAELVQLWQERRTERTHSPATLYRDQSIIPRIIERLGAIRLKDLSARDVDGFTTWLRTLEHRGRPLSESTVAHHFVALQSIITQGEKWDMCTRACILKADKPKPDKPEIEPPAPDVLAAIYRTLPDKLRIPVLVLVATGIRRGELCGLKWSDIDFDRGILNVARSVHAYPDGRLVDKKPKSGKPRKVILAGPVITELGRWHAHLVDRSGGHLAVDARILPNLAADMRGRAPVRPNWLTDNWTAHCTKTGTHVRLHDLRHFYVTYLLDAGVPINTVQGLAGHHAASFTFNHYGSRSATGDQLALQASGNLVDILAKDSSD